MKIRTNIFILSIAWGFLSPSMSYAQDVDCASQSDQSADLVLYNGSVYTSDLALVNQLNSPYRSTITQSIAINSETGCIVYVGDESGVLAQNSPYIDSNTRFINLKGKLVLPGLIDSHVHPMFGAISDVTGVSVNPFASPDTQISQIKSFVDANPQFNDYSVDGLGIEIFVSTGTTFNRQTLDAIVADKPLRVGYVWGHKSWVNTKTLVDAGISLAPCLSPCVPTDPPGGIVVRDENGVPTGELVEYASYIVDDQFTQPTKAQIKLGLVGEPEGTSPSETILGRNHVSVIQSYHQGGFTTVHDMSTVNKTSTLTAMQAVNELAMDMANPLQLRFLMSWYLGPEDIQDCVDPNAVNSGTVECLINEINLNNDMLVTTDKFRHDFIKVFMDGTLETFTGSVLPKNGQAYVCENDFSQALGCIPGGNGIEGWEAFAGANLKDAIKLMNQAGFNINAHAIGDKAVRNALIALENAQLEVGNSWDGSRKFSLEHLQMVDPADIIRMRDLNVVASTSPYWMGADDFLGLYQIPLLGFERAYKEEYPLQSFFNEDVLVVAGSDGLRLNEGTLMEQVYTGMTRLFSPSLYSIFYCCFPSPDTRGWQKLFPYFADLDKIFTEDDWDLENNDVFPIGVLPPQAERVADVEHLIEMFTINAAIAGNIDDKIGSLEVGKKADVIILDTDIITAGKQFAQSGNLDDAAPIAGAQVLMTIFDGDVVFVKEGNGKVKIQSKPTP